MISETRQTADEAIGSVSDDSAEYMPTAGEIACRAAAIRGGWTDAQRKRRRVTAINLWLPPCVGLADIAANVTSDQAV